MCVGTREGASIFSQLPANLLQEQNKLYEVWAITRINAMRVMTPFGPVCEWASVGCVGCVRIWKKHTK